jgi:hypothetical protein
MALKDALVRMEEKAMSELASESSTQRPREALAEPGGRWPAELAEQAGAGKHSEGER